LSIADTARLTLTATTAAPVGQSTISVKAHATGATDVTASLVLTVSAAPPLFALSFCPSDVPNWLAYQNDAGPWTRVVPDADRVFRFRVGARGGIAAMYGDSSSQDRVLRVEYLTAAEIGPRFQCANVPKATKSVTGSVVALRVGCVP